MKRRKEITVMTNLFSKGQYKFHIMLNLNEKEIEFTTRTTHDLCRIQQDQAEDYFDFIFPDELSEDAKTFLKLLAIKSIFPRLDESCLNVTEYGLNLECVRTYLHKTRKGELKYDVKYRYKGELSFI
jgi:hypothetical protein